MLPSFLSLVSWYDAYIRRCFTAAGLTQQTIDLDGETTIAVWAPKPRPGRTRKRPLILLHGFGPMAIWQWRRQVQSFAPDFDVYVPDLVFFGGSTTKSPERSEIFQAASVGKLLEKLGLNKVYVMGTSYGGFVAYHMARMYPERVEKVVIASSGVNMRRRDNEALLKRANLERIEDFLLPVTADQLRTLTSLAMSKKVPDFLPDFFFSDFVNRFYRESRSEKMELLKGLTLGTDDSVNLSPLKQEVLLVWGENDQIFPLEMTRELKQILGEKTKLEVIKRSSHVPQIECPEQFNTIVRSFLSGS